MGWSSYIFNYDYSFFHRALDIPAAEILQVAELAILRGSEIIEHSQCCDEITFVISGSATVYSGDHIYHIQPGEVHYLKKSMYHKIVADEQENLRYCCIGFLLKPDCKQIDGFTKSVQEISDCITTDDGSIRTLFPLLLDEIHMQDEDSNAMIHFYFCQMLIHLSRILRGKSRNPVDRQNAATPSHAVYRTLKLIDENYRELTQVRQIANTLAYSEYYLCHVFMDSMNITVKDYLMQKKVHAAANLLKNSNMSISDIAELFHFSSLHTFSLAFKRYMAISPSQYRTNSRSNMEGIV